MSDRQDILARLETIIDARLLSGEPEGSYTAQLAAAGLTRVAQKVGEEGVEVALAAATGAGDDELLGEAADLVYHLLVLLRMRGVALDDVRRVLAERHGGRG
jgi:phosphoribosyl-ATP pyrophosphohydrolase/phosphoribosyl-AMP cyclohydrolase